MDRLSLRLGPDGQTIRHATSRLGTNRPEDEEPPGSDADRTTYLSKSRYLTGRENPREMWFEAREDRSPGIGDRWRMEQGKLIDELARQRFPEGVFVGGSPSQEQLQAGKPLFEARLAHVSAGLNNLFYLLSTNVLSMFQETAPDPVG